MQELYLDSTDSTNSHARRIAAGSQPVQPLFIYTSYQTAGRGQRGNTWEAAPGANLLFSLLFIPEGVAPSAQFSISEAVALAIADALAEYGVATKVKWPNDIYAGDRKICGILIEHSLMGNSIQYTIAGAGINVNQTEFVSDAPNPTSMKNILGHDIDLTAFRQCVIRHLDKRLTLSNTDMPGLASPFELHAEFMRRLWRGDGLMYPFREPATGAMLTARIHSVAPGGMLRLELPDGAIRSYAFKEIEFIL